MHFRRRQQVATAGLAVAALALAACSSSSSSSTSSAAGSTSSASASSNSSLSGTLNGSGSTFQTVFQEAAISAYKSVAPNVTVNYGSGGSGKGRTDLASGVVNYRGLGLADPVLGDGELQGQDGAVLPRHHRPDRAGLQPVRRDAT